MLISFKSNITKISLYGKTTIADLIPRFYDVSKGRIIIDGTDIREVLIEKLRKLMGIVSQDTILFNDTVSNNISYGFPDANFEAIKKASEAANAMEFITKLPNGFDTIIKWHKSSILVAD